MIAKIRGNIDYIRDNYVVVDVAGVGYKIFVTLYTLGKIAISSEKKIEKSEISFFIHTYVREDTLALYGFLEVEELEMFELLINISGIGPKAALGILSIADAKTVKTAVLNEDATILTKVSGVGKKTAERVILELKNKISDLPIFEKNQISSDSDALEALVAMGYSNFEARESLKLIANDIKDVGEKVKAALKILGKK